MQFYVVDMTRIILVLSGKGGVGKTTIVSKIADCVRNGLIDDISDIRDESDRKGMRIVIELKRDADSNVVLNNLYKIESIL